MKRLAKKEFFWLGLILLFVFWQTRFLFFPGFYPFSDEPHIANLHQMIRAITGKQLPPRWAPDMSFNFGYPLFNFYYPLPFYLGAFFFLVFKMSLVWSLKLVFALSVFLSGIAFYFLARKFFDQIASFAVAIVYLYTPYRAVNLYVRGAVGEMWGFVFMPLVLLTFINLAEKKTTRSFITTASSRMPQASVPGDEAQLPETSGSSKAGVRSRGRSFDRDFIWASLSLAGLILAHNLTPILFLPFLALAVLFYLWLLAPKKEQGRGFRFFLLAIFLGLTLSAYYWLPAVLEKKYIQPETPFNPYDHFPFIRQLIFPSWGYGASVWGPGDGLSFQIGTVNLIAVASSLLIFAFFRKRLTKEQKWLLIFSLFVFSFAFSMMNIRSWLIWQLVPLASYVQFPWRLLMLTTFSSSLMVGFGGSLARKKWLKSLPLLLALLNLGLTLNYFKPAKRLAVDDDYYLRRFFINQTSQGRREDLSSEYFNYSEDYLPLTIWTKERPGSLPPKVEIEDPGAEIAFLEKSPTDFEIKTRAPKEASLVINSYYFPGWQATIDDGEVPISPAEPWGQMEIEVPSGEHLIQVNLRESGVRKVANWISLLGLGVVLVIFGREKKA